MLKSSQKISGATIPPVQKTFHAVPLTPLLSNVLTSESAALSQSANKTAAIEKLLPPEKSIIPSLKVPTISEDKAELVDKLITAFLDSYGFEISSPSTENTKAYDVDTGISVTEPTVVAMSEFIPVYVEGSKNDKGKALSLKETSKVVNAKAAINVLVQSEDIKKQVISNKDQVKKFLDEEDVFVEKLSLLMESVISTLDLSSFALPKSQYEGVVESFVEVLTDGGYSSDDIENFSSTKIWQQALIEAKRTLMTNTPGLVSQKFTRSQISSDKDSYVLSDVDSVPSGLIRLWANPSQVLPDITSLTKKDQVANNTAIFLTALKNQYINLVTSNTPEKPQQPVQVGNANNVFSQVNVGGLNDSVLNTVLTKDALTKYEPSGRDISVVANIIFKESVYSSFLSNTENVTLLSSRFGYVVNNNIPNIPVWDYVIGKFPESVANLVTTPRGNGSSLVSFSQVAQPITNSSNYYNVLTFEKSAPTNTNITPGSYYYVDSSLRTNDGKTFDSSRINLLSSKIKTALSTCATIYNMIGYDTITKTRKKSVEEFTLESIIDNLDVVTKTLLKSMKVSQSGVESFNPTSLTNDDNLNVRLAAIVCKSALYPTLAYSKNSDALKSLLFMWIINVIASQVDNVSNDDTIAEIKGQIIALLSVTPTAIDPTEVSYAVNEGRTYPLDVCDNQNTYELMSPPTNTEDNAFIDELLVMAENGYKSYIATKLASKGFDESKGLWKTVVSLMKKIYTNKSIFVSDFTSYTHLSKMAYMFSYFDMLLRIISAQTPENLESVYSTSYQYKHNYMTLGGTTQTDTLGVAIHHEIGLLVSKVETEQLTDFYNEDKLTSSSDAKTVVSKLTDAISFLKAEETSSSEKIAIFWKYLIMLSLHVHDFSDFMNKNFEAHLSKLQAIYDADTNLSSKQKNALINLSLTEDQMRLSRYVMSELSDRISSTPSSISKLLSVPSFADFPKDFSYFMNVNDTDLISCQMLMPFFKSNEFLSAKGNNKRIVSIGIPPSLNTKLRASFGYSPDVTTAMMQSIVRVKVYRLDKLHPDLVFLPKSYLFEMNRFPTRILDNWDYNTFASDETNILSIPSKVVLPGSTISLNRDFTDAFPADKYGDSLTQEEMFEIYSNHSISFLLEEYIRWFTDCRLEDTRYYNYSELKGELETVNSQFAKFSQLSEKSAAVKSSQTYGNVLTTFTDPTSKQTFNVPIKKSSSKSYLTTTSKISINEQVSNSVISSAVDRLATKPMLLDMNNTMKAFFQNETFLIDPEKFIRRVLYPKKFDRVFNVIVDPDDFYVDQSMVSEKTIDDLREAGVLAGGPKKSKLQFASQNYQPYRHRDTSPDDVVLDEYFITVEPYDYVEDYGS